VKIIQLTHVFTSAYWSIVNKQGCFIWINVCNYCQYKSIYVAALGHTLKQPYI